MLINLHILYDSTPYLIWLDDFLVSRLYDLQVYANEFFNFLNSGQFINPKVFRYWSRYYMLRSCMYIFEDSLIAHYNPVSNAFNTTYNTCQPCVTHLLSLRSPRTVPRMTDERPCGPCRTLPPAPLSRAYHLGARPAIFRSLVPLIGSIGEMQRVYTLPPWAKNLWATRGRNIQRKHKKGNREKGKKGKRVGARRWRKNGIVSSAYARVVSEATTKCVPEGN